jgi:RPA family protein
MTHQADDTVWSLVTITGTISSRQVRTGRDGIVRFSIKNSNGFFYTQCQQCQFDTKQLLLLRQGTRVMVTGHLVSFFDARLKLHQTAVIAQSLVVVQDGRTIQLLRNLKVIADTHQG